MIRNLVHDPMLLAIPSQPANKADAAAGQDLLDTLNAHRETCVGMAANMIGIRKRIIVFIDGGKAVLMYNPEITAKAVPFETEEGCLSLLGDPRKTTRWQQITVRFQDSRFQQKTKRFQGFTAQIIQHEIDHCNGVLI